MMFRPRSFEQYEVGVGWTTLGRTVTEADIVIHAGQTGDFYPHHMDAEWSAGQDFGRRIAHGTLILSVAVGMTAGDVNPLAFSYGYERIRFVRPVHIGDTITTEAIVSGKREDMKRPSRGFVDEKCTVRNQDGEVVLALIHVYSVQREDATAALTSRPGAGGRSG